MNENSKTKSLLIVIGGILSVLLIIAGIIAAVFSVRQITCKHSWDGGTVKTEATCSEEGELVYQCEICYKKQSQAIPTISHTWQFVPEKAATCTQDGHTAYTVCKVCDSYKDGHEKQVYLAQGHHVVDDVACDATCTEPGITAGKHCETCGEVLVQQRVIPALNHTIVQVAAKAATCTEPGNTAGQKCVNCGTVYVGCEEIPAGHMNENGDENCDRCGQSAVRRIDSADEFIPGKWYRFYLNPDDPNAKVYIKLNLMYDGGFDGWFKSPGKDLEVDLPFVIIGLTQQGGLILYGDEILEVDADVECGDNYVDVYFDDTPYYAGVDNASTKIYFTINDYTEALEVFSTNGSYVAVLDASILGYRL